MVITERERELYDRAAHYSAEADRWRRLCWLLIAVIGCAIAIGLVGIMEQESIPAVVPVTKGDVQWRS